MDPKRQPLQHGEGSYEPLLRYVHTQLRQQMPTKLTTGGIQQNESMKRREKD